MTPHAALRRLFRHAITAAMVVVMAGGLLAACAAPQSASHVAAPTGEAGVAPPVATPSPTTPDPSAPTAPASAATPVKVDTTCRTSADCTVKNVGNCCGYYPACVNANSPTDPRGVQAECARSGRVSVCGFREISACQCVKGQCEAAPGGLEVH